jgi:DNA gyrase subunit A
MTQRGYIKRIDPKTFSKQNRATRGKTMGKMRGGDEVTKATHCAGLDTVLFFTDRGRVHAVRAYTIPEASTTALGTPFTRVLKLAEGESITAMLPVSSADEAEAGGTDEPHLVMVTARGLIKKTCASEFVSIRNNGKKALLLRAGDRLKHVGTVREGDGILVGGIDGQVIHFDGDSIRPQGRAAAGVKAMAFKADAKKAAGSEKTLREEEDDAGDALPANVAGMVVVPSATVKALELDKASAAAAAGSSSPEGDEELEELACDPETDAKCAEGPMLMLLSASGRGKRISLSAFKQQTRAGRGKRGMGLLKGDAVAAMCVTGFDGARGENVIVGSQNGVMNRYDVDSIRPQSGTAAKGVTLMKLGKGDTVSVLTLLPAELAEENERTESNE